MMRPCRLFKVLLFFAFLSGISTLNAGNPDNPYFFIQISDPQFGFFENNNGFQEETKLYEKAVIEINRLKPDFVVITGDLVNNVNDRSQIEEFRRITAKIDKKIPVYYTPGNHDIGQSLSKQDIGLFISDFGYDKFSFKHKKSLFIGLNSPIIKANTPSLEKEQFAWLKKELSKGRRTSHKIIFCHHPFFINSFDEPEAYFNMSSEIRNKYFALFKENNVDAVFTGHLHNNGYARYGDIEMVTTSAVGKPLGKVPSGFRIVKVYTDRIENVYYGLDEIPETVTFK